LLSPFWSRKANAAPATPHHSHVTSSSSASTPPT
jgi:hypothetical protein